MKAPTIGIFGGSGFVGGVLANRLVERGCQLRIFTRDREHARHLWVLPDTEVTAVDPTDAEQVAAAINGCGAIVNLIGILNERRDNGAEFREVHTDTTVRLARACKRAGVPRMLHMSALKADSFAPSYYLRSKGEAEKLLLAEQDDRFRATIMRPSVIFGPGDDFTNRFARLLKWAPGIFPLACARARFQPVYVGDVADAFVRSLEDRSTEGASLDLGGPSVMTLAEIVEYLARILARHVVVLPLGKALSSLQARVLELFPGKPFSRDNLRSLREDSVLSGPNGLETLGIRPTPMEVVVPQYLGDRNIRRRYYEYRAEAKRTL